MEVSDLIKNRRTELELSQAEIANAVGVSESTISRWESGNIQNMKRSRIAALAKILRLSPSDITDWDSGDITEAARPLLTTAEQRIGLAYGKAPQREQSIVEQVLEPYIDDTEDVIYIKWRISEQAAAAGNGIYLGPETFTEYDVDESKLPRGAAFGVPISGDSMEPKYHDGDIAIISKDFPDVGQVGLFTFDGNGYIKKRGEGVLESFNPQYDDILITDDVIINGRVIGVITWDDVRK